MNKSQKCQLMQDDIGLMTLWCLSKYRGILRGLSARRSCQLMSRKKANVYLKPFSHTTLRRIYTSDIILNDMKRGARRMIMILTVVWVKILPKGQTGGNYGCQLVCLSWHPWCIQKLWQSPNCHRWAELWARAFIFTHRPQQVQSVFRQV